MFLYIFVCSSRYKILKIQHIYNKMAQKMLLKSARFSRITFLPKKVSVLVEVSVLVVRVLVVGTVLLYLFIYPYTPVWG